jgi:hypothetical protein
MDEDIVASSSTKPIAERILSERFKQAIRLGEPSDLGGSARSQVLRFAVLDGSSEAPGSVIVKRTDWWEPASYGW